jgi:hypothetical protein
MTDTLPPLPEPQALCAGAFTADQMREYGKACAALPAAQPTCRAEQKGPQEWVCDCDGPRADCKPALMAEAERLVGEFSKHRYDTAFADTILDKRTAHDARERANKSRAALLAWMTAHTVPLYAAPVAQTLTDGVGLADSKTKAPGDADGGSDA